MALLTSWILQAAGPELRNILNNSYSHMTTQLRKDLFANAPTDISERTHLVEIWIRRLNLIKFGLASFPIVDAESATSTSMLSSTRPPIAHHSPHSGSTLASQEDDSYIPITACLQRDQYQCIITGRKFTDNSNTNFKLNVVNIIPLTLANHPSCRGLDFWKMMEMFCGVENTDKIFVNLLDKIHGLENLITLDNTVCALLDSGRLTFVPGTSLNNYIPVINDHIGSYWLEIGYPQWFEQGLPEFILSIKGLRAGQTTTLIPGSKVDIMCHLATSGDTCTTLPQPSSSYFALRTFILSIKLDCANDALSTRFGYSSVYYAPLTYAHLELGSGCDPTTCDGSISPPEFGSGYSTYPTTCDSPSADPVLAAVAIVEDSVDCGDLER